MRLWKNLLAVGLLLCLVVGVALWRHVNTQIVVDKNQRDGRIQIKSDINNLAVTVTDPVRLESLLAELGVWEHIQLFGQGWVLEVPQRVVINFTPQIQPWLQHKDDKGVVLTSFDGTLVDGTLTVSIHSNLEAWRGYYGKRFDINRHFTALLIQGLYHHTRAPENFGNENENLDTLVNRYIDQPFLLVRQIISWWKQNGWYWEWMVPPVHAACTGPLTTCRYESVVKRCVGGPLAGIPCDFDYRCVPDQGGDCVEIRLCDGSTAYSVSCPVLGRAACLISGCTLGLCVKSGGCSWSDGLPPPTPPPGSSPPQPTQPVCTPANPGEAVPSCSVNGRSIVVAITPPPGYDIATKGVYIWTNCLGSDRYFTNPVTFSNIPAGTSCGFELGTYDNCKDWQWNITDGFEPQTWCSMEGRPVCTMNATTMAAPGANNVWLQVTAQSYSAPNGLQRTHVYLERADGAQISPAPAGTTHLEVSGHHFYRVDNLYVDSDGDGWPPSSSTLVTLPLGNYYAHCQENQGGYWCSGNPFCSYEGETPAVAPGLELNCNSGTPHGDSYVS